MSKDSEANKDVVASLNIEQLPGDYDCQWHTKAGKVFMFEEILPNGICPWLYNSIYPYFLGLLYGAKFSWNDQGDCNVCCPAIEGVDTLVCRRPNDGSFDERISEKMVFVIFAEVVKVHGACPRGHGVGQTFVFPTCMPEHYMCPAAFHNLFPLIELELPSCLDRKRLRCPDWNNVITLSAEALSSEMNQGK